MGASHSWIILTMGDRPAEVSAAVASIRAQSVPADEIIVVGNGVELDPIDGATVVSLPENLGICDGRNEGAARATGDILFFLDDDARCLGDSVTADTLELRRMMLMSFETEPPAGMVDLMLERVHTDRVGLQ